MDFDRNFFSEGLRTLGNVLPYAALAVVVEFAFRVANESFFNEAHQLQRDTQLDYSLQVAPLFAGHLVYIFASILVWPLLAHAAFRETLKPIFQAPPPHFTALVGFIWRWICLWVALAVLAGALVEPLFGLPEDEEISRSSVFAFNLAWCFALVLVLSSFGTWLPAHVADQQVTLRDAVARGSRQFKYALIRLLCGPGLVVGVAFTVVDLTHLFSERDTSLLTEDGSIDYTNAVIEVCHILVLAMSIILAAVVLSRAYIRDLDAGPT